MTRVMVLLVALAVALAGATTAPATTPALFKNCKALNAKYPHGVGRAGARDKSKSGDPVTTFKRSTALYDKAIKANSRLDGDKDGVACEKA
jgi:excalibur calcium-binding domain-containing protein